MTDIDYLALAQAELAQEDTSTEPTAEAVPAGLPTSAPAPENTSRGLSEASVPKPTFKKVQLRDGSTYMEYVKPKPQKAPVSLGDEVARAGMSAVIGATKAVVNTAKAGLELAESGQLSPFGGIDPAKLGAKPEDGIQFSAAIQEPEGLDASQQTLVTGASEGIAQFTTGFLAFGRVLKAAQWMQGTVRGLATSRAMTVGAMADFTVFDPTGGRLSDLIEENPALSNPITEYLKSDEDDTALEGRFKNAVEGLAAGGLVDGLFGALRGVKKVLRATKAGGDEAGLKAAAEVVDELDPPKAPKVEPEVALAPEVKPPETVALEDSIKTHVKSLMDGGALDAPARANAVTNLSRYAVDNGVKNVMNIMDDALAPEIAKARALGKTLDKTEMEAVASMLSTDAETMLVEIAQQHKSLENVDVMLTKARMLKASLAESIAKESEKIAAGGGDAAARDKMLDLYGEVNVHVLGSSAKIGRALSAHRILAKAEGLPPGAMDRLLAQSNGDPEVLEKLLRPPQGILAKGGNVLLEYWMNSLLSGPKTQVVNAVTNTINTFLRPLERAVGGVLSFNPQAATEGAGELLRLHTFVKDSVRQARRALNEGHSILDSTDKLDDITPAISAKNLGIEQGTLVGNTVDFLGTLVRIPSRLLMTTDEFFKQMNYRSRVVAEAATEGTQLGLKGDALGKFVGERLDQAFDASGRASDVAPNALKEAQEATFTNRQAPGSLTDTVNKLANSHPWMRVVVPFINTPVNILKTAGRHTPGVNLLMDSFRKDISGANGASRKALAAGQMAFGGVLVTSGVLLSTEGKLTGGGPKDPQARKRLQESGWRPYSLKIGNEYFAIERFDPYSVPLTIIADLVEAAGELDDATMGDIAGALVASTAKSITDRSYLQGLSNVLEALQSDDPNKVKRVLQNYAGSLVPSAANEVRKSADPTIREVRDMLDAVRNRIPGFSDALPPRRDILGAPMTYSPGWGPDWAPFGQYGIENDKVLSEIAALAAPVNQVAPKRGNVDLREFTTDSGQQAYDRYLQLVGEDGEARAALKDLFQSKEWKEWKEVEVSQAQSGQTPTTTQRTAMILGKFREKAWYTLLSESKALQQATSQDRMNSQRARGGAEIPEALRQLIKP